MSGDRLCRRRRILSMCPDHIRRICGDHIKRRCSKYRRCLLDISGHDLDLILKMVIAHAPACHIRTFFLDLKRLKIFCFCFGLHQDRDNSRTGTKIEHALPFFCLCKPGKQNGIHPKTEPFRILNDKIAVAMQFIKSLLLINQIIWHRQFWIFLPYLLMRKVPLIPAQSALHDLFCVLV